MKTGWLSKDMDSEELFAMLWAMKWVVTGFLFLITFYGGFDPISFNLEVE